MSFGNRSKGNYFTNAFENLNAIRLNLALIGNFDVGNMTYEDCLQCLKTHGEWTKK